MSRYAQEHPDEPDFPIDEVLDRAAERRIERDIIARAEVGEKQTDAERRSDSERWQEEDLHRAEIESGSEWGDEGDE